MSEGLGPEEATQAADDTCALLTAAHHWQAHKASAEPSDGIVGLLAELKEDGDRMESTVAALVVLAHAWVDLTCSLDFDGDWPAVMDWVRREVLVAP